jgi:uncharacterized protein DUF2283
MKLEYDVEADAAYIRFSETPRSRTEEVSEGQRHIMCPLPIHHRSRGKPSGRQFQVRTEPSAAPDCLQLTLRFSFRQQVSAGVRPSTIRR